MIPSASNEENPTAITWIADEDGARELVGLPKKPAVGLQKSGESSVFVDIYRFCTACLENHVSKAIDDGPSCLFLQCPDPNCRAVIGQDRVNMLVSDEGKIKYKEYLIKSYVEDHKFIKWCPAPNCECAIQYLRGVSYDVTCRCWSNFCWNCLGEAHSPVDCETAANWMLKNISES
ncbi:hypothetical protein POM88_010297 [Heracleum sosnowskyi]|uniref:RBR-type E3 ubiquitin transferase n=1 Tax=Heracleum sosnowskyi TaxID=360622 RepID=A0AAD8IUT9_9APIA|nr:hypothetical protein POM88_010297 [Heracleum sosnowskyi]